MKSYCKYFLHDNVFGENPFTRLWIYCQFAVNFTYVFRTSSCTFSFDAQRFNMQQNLKQNSQNELPTEIISIRFQLHHAFQFSCW